MPTLARPSLNTLRYHGLAPALTAKPEPKAERKVRCWHLERGERGSVDQCTAEAVDPQGEILICQKHLAAALEMAGRLPGITITITAAGGDGR